MAATTQKPTYCLGNSFIRVTIVLSSGLSKSKNLLIADVQRHYLFLYMEAATVYMINTLFCPPTPSH